jgi:hypothetical protein
MERMVQYVKDGTEAFDDLPRRRARAEVKENVRAHA